MNKVLIFLAVLLPAIGVHAQVVERERPSEWSQLVEGARFMDRFLPMPKGETIEGVWGIDALQRRYVDNGIESPETSFWGGNILWTSDGKYHLYVCGWPEDSPKGHMFWRNSTVFHAVCDNSVGPFKIENTLGKGHNPEAFRLKDGRVVVYVIDGYYIADKEDSRVWTYGTFQFDPRDRKVIEGLSNLTFAQRQDGSYLMVCRGGGVWISQDGLSPYQQITDSRVYPAVEGRFEDPVVWRDRLQYHLIVNDWLGRIAFYQRSKDGVHWVTEQGEAYVPGVSFHPDGEIEPWFKYERLKILQDEYGRAVQANFAVIDTLKWEDLPNDRHSSKNISIPLNKGLLLEVLNKKEITASTKHIELRIKAEDGFYPQTDLDVESLRFGSYAEVNFGRGSKSVRSRIDGKDLIVTFDGKESGITSDEFAPKLIGKDKAGKMVFGYAALPYVDYNPPILSACKPEYEDGTLKVEVKNFGLSDSVPAEIEVFSDGLSLGMASVGKLMPYETQIVAITDISQPLNPEAIYEVVFQIDGKEIERNKFEYIEKKYPAMIKNLLTCLASALFLFGCTTNEYVKITNPILDGYFADPSIVLHEGKYYIYATIDPWGGEELAVFETKDFVNFERRHINWPTKEACTSPTSGRDKVWAPSVVQGTDGLFHMYVSVGNEIWAGVAAHPLGPWRNAKDDGSPLIPRNMIPGYHMIDAECFIDDDGQAYLYWGSGLGWVNGKCFMASLAANMTDFLEGPVDVTPANYFEGPVMMKKDSTYYLMYSNGKAIDHTYNVRYATARSPWGPFEEGHNSPILKTSSDSTTYGPGHHCVFSRGGQDYILYHRIFPQKEDYVLRQLCLDSLNFDGNGSIKKVDPVGVTLPVL